MRSFIRLSAVMFALILTANVATAQGGGGGGGGGGGAMGGRGGPAGQRNADRYLAEITLTDAQKAKVTELVTWYDAEAAKLPAPARDADSTTRATAMAARMKLTTEFQGKIRAALTPDQTAKFDENVKAAGQRGGGRGRGQ